MNFVEVAPAGQPALPIKDQKKMQRKTAQSFQTRTLQNLPFVTKIDLRTEWIHYEVQEECFDSRTYMGVVRGMRKV